jgi:hypothetical protein
MSYKMIQRNDGSVVVELRADEHMEYQADNGERGLDIRPIATGDIGCLVSNQTERGEIECMILVGDTDGVVGNTSPTVKRGYGWRGTTNGVGVYAHGIRRCESVEPLKRGTGWRIVFSRMAD